MGSYQEDYDQQSIDMDYLEQEGYDQQSIDMGEKCQQQENSSPLELRCQINAL